MLLAFALPSELQQRTDDLVRGQTLRRWELAERRRRKSLRESAQSTSGPSFLSNVTRTASLVLSRRSGSISVSAGPGSTRALKSHDTAREGYGVPLDDIDASSNVTLHSPLPSVLEPRASVGSSSGASENPFVHPSEHTPTRFLSPATPTPTLPPSSPPSPSPFSDSRGRPASPADLPTDARKRSSGSREPFVPPPRPLDLPSTPTGTPRVTPLQPTSQPALQPPQREDPEQRQEVRWWHDWLCGCGEGPDRGGDNQVRGFAKRHLCNARSRPRRIRRLVVRIRLNRHFSFTLVSRYTTYPSAHIHCGRVHKLLFFSIDDIQRAPYPSFVFHSIYPAYLFPYVACSVDHSGHCNMRR